MAYSNIQRIPLVKTCLTCKKELDVSNFYLTTKHNRPYYYPHCIICERHRQGLRRQSKLAVIKDLDGEIWIKLYNGEYEFSNYGRLKILNKEYSIRIGNATLQSNGYLVHSLSINGNVIGKTVHRLLAQNFIPNPNNYETVNHKNGVKTDNRLENLEWCTYADNNAHARLHKLNNNIAEKHSGSKLLNYQVLEIFNSKLPQPKLAKKYNVRNRIISSIKTGLTWGSVTGKKYKKICHTAV